MYGSTQHKLIDEDKECIKNWQTYALLDRLPYECGCTAEAYPEDVEAIKTMKRWSEERQRKEKKKEEMKQRTLNKLRASRR